ncbi:MAG: TonB-dependent receptor, partial [Phototrophicales bacterium]
MLNQPTHYQGGKRMLKKFIILLVVLSLPVAAISSTVGKVSGKITDRETGEALPGANVQIDGTTLGAATDVNGEFVILNVPVGRYTIKASFIGYQTVSISN